MWVGTEGSFKDKRYDVGKENFSSAIHVIVPFIWKLRHSLIFANLWEEILQLLITVVSSLGFLLSCQNYQFYCFTLQSENTRNVKEVYISIKLVLLLDNLGLCKSPKYF